MTVSSDLAAIQQQLAPLLEGEEYDRAAVLLEAVIDDHPALRTVYASVLIHSERFAEAIRALGGDTANDERAIFARAYCQYRLGQYHEAYQTIDQRAADLSLSLRLKTLLAQTLYRLNRFGEAAKQYDELDSDETDDDRIKVNKLAALTCQAALQGSNHADDDGQHLFDASHETQFNASCYLAAQNKLEQALSLVETALEWATQEQFSTVRELREGGKMMEDSYNSGSREMRPYYLQRALLHVKLGHHQEATTDLDRILAVGPTGAKDADAIDEIAQFHQRLLHLASAKDSFKSLPELVDALLKSPTWGRLGPTQIPVAKLYLAWAFYLRAGMIDTKASNGGLPMDPAASQRLYKSAARLLRKLVKIPLTRTLATALLFRTLLAMGCMNEIKGRSRHCTLMASCLVIHRRLERQDTRMDAERTRPHNYPKEMTDQVGLGLAGVLSSISVKRKNHQPEVWHNLQSRTTDLNGYPLEGRVAEAWSRMASANPQDCCAKDLITLGEESKSTGTPPSSLAIAIAFVRALEGKNDKQTDEVY